MHSNQTPAREFCPSKPNFNWFLERSMVLIFVFFLVIPFFILPNPFMALVISGINSLLIIILFTYYVSIVKDLSQKNVFHNPSNNPWNCYLIIYNRLDCKNNLEYLAKFICKIKITYYGEFFES